MRQIEKWMVQAIRDNVADKTNGNTRVHAIIGGHEVQLHGNIIAHVDASRGSVRFTMAGWPTRTTRSRINALLSEFCPLNFYVYQRHGKQHFHGPGDFPIDPREWVQA